MLGTERVGYSVEVDSSDKTDSGHWQWRWQSLDCLGLARPASSCLQSRASGKGREYGAVYPTLHLHATRTEQYTLSYTYTLPTLPYSYKAVT